MTSNERVKTKPMQPEQPTVLVVDDDADNRELLERRLLRSGCAVLLAEHGRQALELIRARAPDLVLLDIIMPVLDGFGVLEQLKQDPQARHIPVIVISADQDMDSVIRCISLGAEDYLPKPFNPVLLQARVGACLEKKRLRDQEQAVYSALEAANAAKNQFISMVAHELKSPMTSIRGYADLMLSGVAGAINTAQRECMETIHASVERMRVLVADLTDISRIESGELRIDLQPISLAGVVEEVRQALRTDLEAKRQSLHVDLPDPLPAVLADRGRVVQILANLLSNAHKYTPEGGRVAVSATLERRAGPDGRAAGVVHVAVRDSGVGIRPEDQPRIFQRFFRASDRAVRDVPGTGLGLNITRHLVELQGGQIWFESAVGEGTAFHFTLPIF